MNEGALSYRVYKVTFRCGCGIEYDVLFPPCSEDWEEETPLPSACCSDRQALPIRCEEVEHPSWDTVREAYKL